MSATLTIGELARAADVPTSTVRYYERIGLLRPIRRSSSGYRVYDEAALERLKFIRAAAATGFRLEDTATLLSLRDGTTAPCRDVQGMLEHRLADVEARLEDLRRVRDVLASSLDGCRTAEASGRCEVMDQLSEKSSSTP